MNVAINVFHIAPNDPKSLRMADPKSQSGAESDALPVADAQPRVRELLPIPKCLFKGMTYKQACTRNVYKCTVNNTEQSTQGQTYWRVEIPNAERETLTQYAVDETLLLQLSDG